MSKYELGDQVVSLDNIAEFKNIVSARVVEELIKLNLDDIEWTKARNLIAYWICFALVAILLRLENQIDVDDNTIKSEIKYAFSEDSNLIVLYHNYSDQLFIATKATLAKLKQIEG